MAHQKARKITDTTCDTTTFTDIPTDLIARLTQEADRRSVPPEDAPALIPLAHQVVLARRED